MMPSEARPPCIGEASPMPSMPSSVWTRTKALCCVGFSSGAQRTWNASMRVIFMAHAPCRSAFNQHRHQRGDKQTVPWRR